VFAEEILEAGKRSITTSFSIRTPKWQGALKFKN